jgi:hypothetical protein
VRYIGLNFAICMVLSLAVTQHSLGQSNSPDACTQLKKDASQVDTKITNETLSAKRQSLLHFLDTHPDDPEDCVTTSTYSRFLDIERHMVLLEAGSNTPALAEWFLQCNSINAKTQHCKGLIADDIAILDDQRLTPSFVAPMPQKPVRIVIDPGMGCRVITLSVTDTESSQNGRRPLVVAHGPGPFQAGILQHRKSPILIAALRCNDGLNFRKAAWLFDK